MVRYTLYKEPGECDLFSVIRYLYYIDHPLLPTVIIERGHPYGMELPAIYDHNANILHSGLNECVGFYEERTGVPNLLDRAITFKSHNKDFHIY